MSTCVLALEGNIIHQQVYRASIENPLHILAPAFYLVA